MRQIRELLTSHKRLAILVIVLLVAAMGWLLLGPKKAAAPQYQTTSVERGTIISSVSASGQVISTGRLPILSQASGVVKQVYVKNGDTVTAGQKILSITLDPVASQKNAAAWSSYLSAKTTLDAANVGLYSDQSTMFTKWNTFYNLATNSTYQNSDNTPNVPARAAAAFASAQDDWLAAEATYKNQQAVVAQAQAALNSSWQNYQQTSPDLTAPVAGTIQDLTYVSGMLVNSSVSSSGITQSQTIASVVTPVLPTVTVNLSEVDVNKVVEGNRVTLTFDALPERTYSGKVVGINKTGVVTSGVTNYPATILLDTNPTEVLPNMSVSANIITATKDNVLLVPSEAIQTSNGQATVRILKNGQVQTITVETGLSSDTQTEVTTGLADGDVVVMGTATSQTQGASQSPFSTFRVGGLGGGGGGFRTGGGGR